MVSSQKESFRISSQDIWIAPGCESGKIRPLDLSVFNFEILFFFFHAVNSVSRLGFGGFFFNWLLLLSLRFLPDVFFEEIFGQDGSSIILDSIVRALPLGQLFEGAVVVVGVAVHVGHAASNLSAVFTGRARHY